MPNRSIQGRWGTLDADDVLVLHRGAEGQIEARRLVEHRGRAGIDEIGAVAARVLDASTRRGFQAVALPRPAHRGSPLLVGAE